MFVSMDAQFPVLVLGAGCFWCSEAVFARVRGVRSVQCGYSNGQVERPSYEDVCTGRTGCNEVVRVEYDPSEITVQQLLTVFFGTHDPTTLDRQGNDVGTQYRSAIYFTTPDQEHVARDLIAELDRQGVFPSPIVTEVLPLNHYWPAEDYHQDYYTQHPRQGYCAYVINPKVAKLRKQFAPLLRPE